MKPVRFTLKKAAIALTGFAISMSILRLVFLELWSAYYDPIQPLHFLSTAAACTPSVAAAAAIASCSLTYIIVSHFRIKHACLSVVGSVLATYAIALLGVWTIS